MSIFLEGAAAEHERVQMLEHLAHCAACREMVFLVQGAEIELRPVVASERPGLGSWGRRWWMPVGLAGAVLAFGLVVVIYMHWPVAPVRNGQMAGVQAPAAVNGPRGEATPPRPPAQPSGQADRLAAPARVAPRGVGSGSGGGIVGYLQGRASRAARCGDERAGVAGCSGELAEVFGEHDSRGSGRQGCRKGAGESCT